MSPVRDHCGVTKKARFRTRGAAEAVLERLRHEATETGNPRRQERRAYACLLCGGFHLSSKERAA